MTDETAINRGEIRDAEKVSLREYNTLVQVLDDAGIIEVDEEENEFTIAESDKE